MSERRIVVGDSTRGDLFVHALAQLPDDARLTLSASGAERGRLEAIARAYAIDERIEFVASGSSGGEPEFSTMGEFVEALGVPDDPPSSWMRAGASLDGERIAVVTNIPAPYRLPLFRRMHERLAADGATLRVFFLSDTPVRSWMNETPDGFDYDVLSSVPLPVRSSRRPLVPGNLERRLSGFRPSIIVAGGLSPFVAMRAAAFARRRAISFGLWSGEIATMATAQSRVRHFQRQRLVRVADFGLAYGFYAAEYFRLLRPELPIVYARNTSVSEALPRTLGSNRPVELLAVGDLTSPRKGIDVALDALRLLPDLDCRLTVVGGGAGLNDLSRAASRDERVRFLGALPPAEVQLEYARADALVFPSRADVFGLALVEAMAAGLATLTASNAGAVGDLPVDGHNAVIVHGHDPADWAESIRRVVENDQLRRALGDAAARSIARRWTVAHSVDAMLAGLRLGAELRTRGQRFDAAPRSSAGRRGGGAMTSVVSGSERRIVAGDTTRGDLFVHALAQLPDDVVLALSSETPERARLELLATAYGIADRISFEKGKGDGTHTSAPASMAALVEGFSDGNSSAASARGDDQMLAGQRVAVVVNLPIHYRVALFTSIAQRLEAAGAAFRVFFLAQPPSTRRWMQPGELCFDHEFLRGIDVRRDRGRRVVPFDLEARLAQFSPTVVVAAGFAPFVAGRTARFARRRGIPFGVWSGEIPSRPTAQSQLRRVQRRRLVRHASFGIAYGHLSGEYLRSVREDLPVVYGRNTTRLVDGHVEPRKRDRVELLTVARVESLKRLDLLVDAVRLLPDEPLQLTVVGDGPALPSLRARAAGDPRIRFLGAIPSDQMQDVYRDADAFLFPSEYDVFGLVLVEALSAGLAVVSSTAPGAVADLAVDERNCLLVRRPDAAAWAHAIERVVRDAHLRSTLGAAARETIRSRWTIEHAADAMIAGFRLGILAGQGART